MPTGYKLSRSDTKKLFHKLAVARSDILAARAACRFFVEHVKETNHTIYYPLFVSVVVCYARPFSDNDTLGRLPKNGARMPTHAFRQHTINYLKLATKSSRTATGT